MYAVFPQAKAILKCLDLSQDGAVSNANFHEYLQNYDIFIAEDKRRTKVHGIPSVFEGGG